MLKHVVESNGAPLGHVDLLRAAGRESRSGDHAVSELQRAELLHILYKSNPAHRIIRLVGPDEREQGDDSRLSKEVSALFQVVDTLSSEGVNFINGEALLQAYRRAYPSYPTKQLWHRIVRDRPRCVTFSDEHLFGPNTGKDSICTRVELVEPHAAVIRDLVMDIERIRHDAPFRMAATWYAQRLISTPVAVACLLAQARADSYRDDDARAEKAELAEQLRGRLAGWLSLKQSMQLGDEWRAYARCQGEDPEIFFPLNDDRPTRAELERAQAVCSPCAARIGCLKWSADHPQIGIWGGYSSVDRANLPAAARELLKQV